MAVRHAFALLLAALLVFASMALPESDPHFGRRFGFGRGFGRYGRHLFGFGHGLGGYGYGGHGYGYGGHGYGYGGHGLGGHGGYGGYGYPYLHYG